MAIINTSSYDEILSEIIKAPRPVHFKWECDIHVGDKIVNPFKITNIDVERDFVTKYCDRINIEVNMSVADYNRLVYPAKDDLFITLRRIPLGEIDDAELPVGQILALKYRAYTMLNSSADLQAMPSSNDELNMGSYSFQLLDLAIEHLRLKTVGGIFHKETTIKVLRTLLGKISVELSLPDEFKIKGVEYVEPSEDTVRQHIVVPHGTELMDLGGYLQKYCGGIYNQALGTYLRKKVWYIYPIHDHTRYDKTRYTMDVVIVPPNRMRQTERTYTIKDEKLLVAITGEVRQKDFTDVDFLNAGNGTRFSLATKMFDGYAPTKGNIPKTAVADTTAQFTVQKRRVGLEHVPFSENKVTDNVAYEMSKIVLRDAQMLIVVWEQSDPEVLYPGMPTKIHYVTEEGTKTLLGTLIKVEAFTQLARPGMTTDRYRTSCAMTFILKSGELPKA